MSQPSCGKEGNDWALGPALFLDLDEAHRRQEPVSFLHITGDEVQIGHACNGA